MTGFRGTNEVPFVARAIRYRIPGASSPSSVFAAWFYGPIATACPSTLDAVMPAEKKKSNHRILKTSIANIY